MPQRPLYGRVYTGHDWDGDIDEDPRISRFETEQDDPDPDPPVDWEP